jgi:hypothetical protein
LGNYSKWKNHFKLTGLCTWNVLKEVFILIAQLLISGMAYFVKELINGLVGPATTFYTWMVVLPLIFLAVGFLRARINGLLFQLSILLVAAFITLITYPKEPLMNFEREVPGLWLN